MHNRFTEKHYVGFGSGSGTNLEQLLLHQDGYKLSAVFSNKPCPLIETFQKKNVPTYTFESDFELRAADALSKLEKPVDYIFLGGFMKILKGEILKRFNGRIINVHPADLSIVGVDGKRLLTGKYGVLKAILCGHREVRSTVHVVNEEVDGGKILHISKPLFIDYDDQILDGFECEYTSSALDQKISSMKKDPKFQKLLSLANEIQQKQKKACDWPAFTYVAKALAKGELNG